MSRSLVRLSVFLSIAAVAGAAAFGRPGDDERDRAFNAGVATAPAALAGSATADPSAAPGDPDGRVRSVVASSHLANSVHACAKMSNGQLRLADETGCLPSEVEVSLSAGEVTPLEVSRVLTLPAEGGPYAGIFGGLLCPGNRTLVSSGFQLMRGGVKIRESFIGPGFGLPRVAIAFAIIDGVTPLPAGEDVVKIWATCM